MPILITVFLIISSTLFACPDLSGRYLECRPTTGHSTGSKDMVVSQSIENDITTYVASAINNQTHERETATYKADGIKTEEMNTDPETGEATLVTSIISCEGDKLSIKISLKSNGNETSSSKINVYKVGHQLIIDSYYRDGNQEASDKEICE